MARAHKMNYGLPHSEEVAFDMLSETETQNSTIIPIFMQDEAKGDPFDKNVNPAHSSFAEDGGPTCYPNSDIRKVFTQLKIWMDKTARVTDNVEFMVFQWMPIYCAFEEDVDIKDDKSGSNIGLWTEMQNEDTDKQSYPLWSGTDMNGGSGLHTDVPGLTGGQTIESVAFDADSFWDAWNYSSFRKKLMTICPGGLRTSIVYKDRPFIVGGWNNVVSKLKHMNPYTFCGLLLHLPQADHPDQMYAAADGTNAALKVSFKSFFYEYNDYFDQAKT